MDYSQLKNREATDLLTGIDLEELYKIHETSRPSFQFKNLMMAIMVLLDFQQDW